MINVDMESHTSERRALRVALHSAKENPFSLVKIRGVGTQFPMWVGEG